jgi:hypothetical protein
MNVQAKIVAEKKPWASIAVYTHLFVKPDFCSFGNPPVLPAVIETLQLVPLKTALVMTNSAIKGGDINKAKTMFNKFSSLWLTVEPIVKSKAGDKYPAIEKDIATIETALGEANPDKVKAGEGLTAAIQRFNELIK